MVDKPYYDEEFKRWREPGGKFISKDVADNWFAEEKRIYSMRVDMNLAPMTRKLSKIEGLFRVSAVQYNSEKRKTSDGSEVQPVPSDVYSAMVLSEYYMETEGDLAQTVLAPMEIAIGRLHVSGANKSHVKYVEDLIRAICLEDVSKEIYYSVEVFGQAYPLEVWSGTTLDAVVPVDPKGVWVTGQSFNEKTLTLPRAMRYYIHPEFDPNSITVGEAFPVPKDTLRPIYAPKAAWKRYATPPMRRAFRPLGTRQLLDEMVRATIEGAKNQLWVFKVGTDKNPADPRYIEYLKNQIEGGNQDRTGQLVWTHDLQVEQHTPKPIDSLLANEKYAALTDQIMACRGISLEFISGATTSGQASRNNEINIEVFMERLKARRRAVEIWFDYLAQKIASKKRWSEAPTIRFAQIEVADTMAIKNRLKPMYETGVMSAKTFLEDSGYDYDSEIAQKKEELPLRDLLTPPLSYVQGVVGRNKDGGTTVEEPKETIKEKLTAEWREEIPGMWGRLMRGEIGSQDFYEWMKSSSNESLETAYRTGYGEAGGQLSIDEEYMKKILDWNIDYLNRYVIQIEQADDPEKLEWRAPLYEEHGTRMAFMYGVFQSMKEHGAKGWQRVLHPELSKSGPCEWCTADAKIIHSMDEPFYDHPKGVCGAKATEVRFFRDHEVPIVFPIPEDE